MKNDEIKEILKGLNHISNSGENASIEFNSKDCKLLSNFITNLQEEYNLMYNRLVSESTLWESKYYDLQEQNKTLKDTLKLRTEISSYIKRKIDKAIEKLNYYKAKPYNEYDIDDVLIDLDYILKGSDE